MMIPSNELLIGYDYDAWYGYGDRIPVTTDASTKSNCMTLICGMSGSGKSYLTNQYFARTCIQGGNYANVFFADFKQDDTFQHLRKCPRYYPYDRTIEALDIVYEILHSRQSGKDNSCNPVILVWDEYTANLLALRENDKKKAETVMRKVSEILMLGRSLNCRIYITSQAAYASVFPEGSRMNFGVIIIVGAPIRSIYEMLIPKEYIERIGERKFTTGEGIALLQGADLHFIKVPVVRDEEKMNALCIEALTR